MRIEYLGDFAKLSFGRAVLDHLIVFWFDFHFFTLYLSFGTVVSVEYLDDLIKLSFGRAVLDHLIDLIFFCLFGLISINLVDVILCLEDSVNLLKHLFALSVAQDISSLEKYGSILLEFNRNGGELSSTHHFCHEIAHVGKQSFENFWLLILVYCLKNLCLQLLPG